MQFNLSVFKHLKIYIYVSFKIIYVARRPEDVAVSFYHLNRLFRTQGYVGDFERYWGYFEKSLSNYLIR